MSYLAVDRSLASVPTSWRVERLRRIARVRREVNIRADAPLLALSAARGVESRPEDGGRQLPSDETITKYWLVHPNDFVFNPMWALEGGVAVSERSGAVSTAYLVYELSHRVWPRFIHYWFRSSVALEQYRLLIRGITTFDRSISREDIEDFPVPLPPIVEQRAIADYLDRETARIDGLIAAKRRMIGLADEAFGARAELSLCREGSHRIPLRRLLKHLPQYGAAESGEVGESDWPRYIRITDLQQDGSLASQDIRRLPPATARPYRLRDRDILIARSGATVGKAFIYQAAMGPCCFAGYLIRFQFDDTKVLPEWVEVWTRTNDYWSQIRAVSLQATIENVGAERFKELRVPTVPIDEQEPILREIGRDRAFSSGLRLILMKQIDLLQERRQALVTAAVTGELPIPGVAA